MGEEYPTEDEFENIELFWENTITGKYRAERQITTREFLSFLDENYEDVTLLGDAFDDIDADTGFYEMSGGESYPSQVEIGIGEDDETVMTIEQDVYIPAELAYGLVGRDEIEENYVVSISVMGDDPLLIETVLQDFEDEYSEFIEETDQLKELAETERARQEEEERAFTTSGETGSEFKKDVSGYSWDDIVLPDETVTRVKEILEKPMENPELYDRFGLEPKGVFLQGEPGVGKTLLAKVIASEVGANFYSANISDLTSLWHGQSGSNVNQLFEDAKEGAPSVIFLDEAEGLLEKRGTERSHGERKDMVDTFLDNMDGIEELEDVRVIAATNKPDLIDDAAIRDGRFDEVLTIQPPDRDSRSEIFQVHAENVNPDAFEDLDYDELADLTDESWTGANIAAVTGRAARIAIRKYQEENGVEIGEIDPEDVKATMDDFRDAIEEHQQDEEDLRRYIL